MDEELKKILKENIEISRESLKILKGIRRSSRMAAVFKTFYWLVILASIAGSYYYFQPYIKVIMTSFDQISDSFSALQKTSETLKAPTGGQGVSSDVLKNLPPDLLKNLQNILKTQ